MFHVIYLKSQLCAKPANPVAVKIVKLRTSDDGHSEGAALVQFLGGSGLPENIKSLSQTFMKVKVYATVICT